MSDELRFVLFLALAAIQALHRERGLVRMLQSPARDGEWECAGPGPEISLAPLDEDWGQLGSYEHLLDD